MLQVTRPALTFYPIPKTFFLQRIFKFEEKYELPHDKSNKLACVPSADSDLPSLIVLLCALWVAKE